MTVIVTDAHYRSSLAAVRALAKCGHSVILTQTADDAGKFIPAFKSKYATRTVLFDCSVCDTDAYKSALISLACEYERPVLLPIGAKTTALIAQNREELLKVCCFTVADADTLALANDKSKVRVAAQKVGITVPHTYEDGEVPSDYPVIIKPRCGEAFGLKASERYIIVHSADKYHEAYAQMEKYGGAPVVQKLVSGDGIGVSLLMSSDGRAVSAICHKRVREYSINGGPSACCESFYDEALVRASERLLASFGFSGIAMVEYKGGHLLEINPRIWGSFPLTYAAGTSFADDYVRLSCGENVYHALDNYERGVKMSFVFNDLAACIGLLRHGRVRDALSGVGDIFFRRVRDGVYDKEDPKPFWCYMRSKILRK